jgi:RND family efflux transporter MFP subunit
MVRVVKWLAASVALMAVVALAWGVYSKVSAGLQESEWRRSVTVPVEVQAVSQGPIRDVRQFTGTLRARSHFEVAPRIAGRLERLAVDIGDSVEHGQVVAVLDDQEYVQQVEQVRAELEVARATLQERQSRLQIAQREFQRIERLGEQQIASEAELDAAQSRFQAEQAGLRVAEAQLTQREAALLAAEVRLSYTQIRAAWENAGQRRVVGERFVDAGATLSANNPIITLLDIDTVIAVINVTERDYMRLHIGQQATVQLNPEEPLTFTGRVARVAPMFYEGSRQARVEIEVANTEHRLKPGMFVRVSLELDRQEDATIIPRQALVRRDGRQGVFVADPVENKVAFVPVRVGITERDRVQVLSPSLAGLVVTLGQHLLSDEAAVRIAELPAGSGTAPAAEALSAVPEPTP